MNLLLFFLIFFFQNFYFRFFNWLLNFCFDFCLFCLNNHFRVLLASHIPELIALKMKNIYCNSTSICTFFKLVQGTSQSSNCNNLSFKILNRNNFIFFEISQASKISNSGPHKIGSIKNVAFNPFINSNTFRKWFISCTDVDTGKEVLFACSINKERIIFTHIDEHFLTRNLIAYNLIIFGEKSLKGRFI